MHCLFFFLLLLLLSRSAREKASKEAQESFPLSPPGEKEKKVRKSLFGSSFLCLPLPVRLIRSSFCHGKREKQKHHGLKEKEIGSRFFAVLPLIFSKSHEAACLSKVRHTVYFFQFMNCSTFRVQIESILQVLPLGYFFLFAFCSVCFLSLIPHADLLVTQSPRGKRLKERAILFGLLNAHPLLLPSSVYLERNGPLRSGATSQM